MSHVLNGTGKVRPATAEAVLEAIRTLGYEPNSVAQSLARASTRSIGVALSGLGNHYCADLVQGIESATSAHGYTLLLADTHDSANEELQAVRELQQRRVDGILLATTVTLPNESLDYLERNQTPVVLIDRLSSSVHDQVGVENKKSTAQLVGLGHMRIGFISGLPNIATSNERVAGLQVWPPQGGPGDRPRSDPRRRVPVGTRPPRDPRPPCACEPPNCRYRGEQPHDAGRHSSAPRGRSASAARHRPGELRRLRMGRHLRIRSANRPVGDDAIRPGDLADHGKGLP